MSEYQNTLIIPDIHGKTVLADKILAKHPEIYRRVFLGDYYDDWRDGPEDASRVTKWLTQRIIENEVDEYENILLLGNHDVQYDPEWKRYRVPQKGNLTRFSWGWTDSKQKAVDEVLEDYMSFDRFWEQFQYYFYDAENVKPTLFSHAGVTGQVYYSLEHFETSLDFSLRGLQQGDLPMESLGHPFSIDEERGGWVRRIGGGVLWCDWSKLQPLKGVRQVVGHTQGNYPRIRGLDLLYCLDTNLQYYGIMHHDTGEIEIRQSL